MKKNVFFLLRGSGEITPPLILVFRPLKITLMLDCFSAFLEPKNWPQKKGFVLVKISGPWNLFNGKAQKMPTISFLR